MNSVIFPQLIKSLISVLLCCFWEDVLWLLRKRWLMCLFVCCSLENCLSCISFCFSQGLGWSWLYRACQSCWKGKQAAGEKGFPPLLSRVQSPLRLALHCSYFTQECLILVFWQGRWERNDLVVLKPASLACVFWQNCLTPFLIGLLPSCWWEKSPVMGQSLHGYRWTRWSWVDLVLKVSNLNESWSQNGKALGMLSGLLFCAEVNREVCYSCILCISR